MIAIVDYGLEKNGALADVLSEIKVDFKITQNEFEILRADKIILPDYTSISMALKQLHLLNLFTVLRVCSKPILGISTGFHLMASRIESENAACLGIFPATVEKFEDANQIGSSGKQRKMIFIKEGKLFKNLRGNENYFFDNSFFLRVDNYTSAVFGNKPTLAAVMEKNNYFGVQFLPEKSGDAGIRFMNNFFEL